MRAAVPRDGRIEVRETADPVPGPGQLLARTLSCAICASDLHFMDNPQGVAEDDSGLWDYHADRHRDGARVRRRDRRLRA